MDEAAHRRRATLLGVKLRALASGHLGVDSVAEPSGFGAGAALVRDGVAWVLLDEHPEQRLGAALAWALRSSATALHVLADAGTGVLARRAAEFAFPVTVWHVEGRTLLPAVAQPFADHVDPPPHQLALVAAIEAAGAVPSVEYGVVAGEVGGLEVCRVVDDPYTGGTRLEAGVGVHDRQAFTMLHGDVPTAAALAGVVTAVVAHRRLDAPSHPLNQLARERLIRAALIADPSQIGLIRLAPGAPPVPRRNLKDPTPCVALGDDRSGTPAVVVCSSGVDLDLVPFAADARALHDPAGTGRLVIVTPPRDQVALLPELVALLRQPAELASYG